MKPNNGQIEKNPLPGEQTFPLGDPSAKPVPGTKGSNLSEHQRNALASMAVGGIPTANIAAAIGRSAQLVKRLLAEDADIRERVEVFQSRVLRVYADQHHQFVEMVDPAMRIIRASVTEGSGTDPRLANENAWKIVNQVFPQKQSVDLNLNGGVSIEAQAVFSSQLVSILASVEELRAAPTGERTFLDRVKTGPDALPGPQSQLQTEVAPVATEPVPEGTPAPPEGMSE